MTGLEILLAVTFAKYGGGLAREGAYRDVFAEKLIGWGFLLAGLAIAGAAGHRL